MELLIESQQSGKNYELFLTQLPQKLFPRIWLGNVPPSFVCSPRTSVKYLARSFIIAVILRHEFKQLLLAIVSRKPDRKGKAHTCLGTYLLHPQAVLTLEVAQTEEHPAPSPSYRQGHQITCTSLRDNNSPDSALRCCKLTQRRE